MKRDNAFTGLEAAIVLIAFVVVAAVFSYVMLGAGFFATQKAQEVTYASIKQATSNVVFEGHVYGKVDHTANPNEFLGFTFSVKVPGGGQPIDMSTTQFIYTSTQTKPPVPIQPEDTDFEKCVDCGAGTKIVYPSTDCTVTPADEEPLYLGYFPEDPARPGFGNPILQPGRSATYTVCIDKPLVSDEWFSIEMVPQVGAATLMTKRLDAGMMNGKALL